MARDPDSDEELSYEERLRPHLPKLLAALAASGAGYGVYRHLRRQRLSSDPALRAVQEASKGTLTHVIPDNPKSSFERLINRVMVGGGPVRYALDVPVDATGVPKIPGAVSQLAGASDVVGDVTFLGPHVDDLARPFLGRDNKLNKALEARIFEKYAPGSMPHTTEMSQLMGPKPGIIQKVRHYLASRKPAETRLKDVENQLRQIYPEGYILKTVGGQATGGHFPSDAKPLTDYLSGGGHQQEVVQALLKDPSQVIAQAKVPIEQGNILDRLYGALRGTPSTREMRVHVMDGAVLPSTTLPRFSPLAHPFTGKQRRKGEEFVRDVLSKLPPDLSKGTYAFDLAPLQGGGFKIIESNPAHRSGLLMPLRNPLAPYLVHKDITGRRGPISSGLAGALTGTGIGLGAHQVAKGLLDEDEDT